MNLFRVGSLFSGSGGFELAASMCSGVPVWASEVEPYPIAVTRSRFPNMEHLGDVSKVHGWNLEPVDVITFGSPCQDMSIAGKRAGIKHEENGDEETTRSGLFMEAVRIIKEMRKATNGRYPAFAVWENVPGAFSSNKGEDFRLVLKELVQIVEPSADVPGVPKVGWSYYDCWRGDGWSLAYRTFDAQYWGVPQRRRRIYLVLDLRGRRAGEVLFKCPGLRGYFEESRTAGEGTSDDAERCTGVCYQPVGCDIYNRKLTGDIACSLTTASCQGAANTGPTVCVPVILDDQGGQQITVRDDGISPTLRAEMHGHPPCVVSAGFKGRQGADSGGVGFGIETAPTIVSGMTADVVCAYDQPIVFDKEVYNSGINGKGGHYIAEGGPAPTLRSGCPPGVCIRYIVRRLTPTECCRLQGFLDGWGEIDPLDISDEREVDRWRHIYKTYCIINGLKVSPSILSKPDRLKKWHDKLHTDSAEYKMWGNGIALPNALYVMQGIADALNT